MVTYVYFVQAGGPTGPVKIGVASDVKNRIYTLQIGNHLELSLLAKFKADSRVHAEWLETKERLRKDRRNGEWR